MSDELNRANGQEQPETAQEPQPAIQPLNGQSRAADSLEGSDSAVAREDATNQGLTDENKAHSTIESTELNTLHQFPAEVSGEPANAQPDGRDALIKDQSEPAPDAREVEAMPPADDAEGGRTKENQPAQPKLDDTDDFWGLDQNDLRVLASYDTVLARGNDLDRMDEDNSNDDEGNSNGIDCFEPSPAIDLVRYVHEDGRGETCVSLFEWVGSKPTVRCGPSKEHGGRQHFVPPLPPGLYESMPLPSGIGQYGSTQNLFDNVHSLLQGYLTLSEKQSALLTYWCIASWFPDVVEFVPRLTITGPRYAVDLLFRMLRCACRRPLLLAGLRPAVLNLIPLNELLPTLFVRETTRSKRTDELLDAGDHRGYFVASGGNMHQCYCAKCVYLGEEYNPQRSVLEGIHIHVARNASLPDRSLPSDQEIQKLQNQLFFYRNLNRDLVAASRYKPSGLLPELCAVARQLGATIVDDNNLQRRVAELLKGQNEQADVDRSSGLTGVVLRAVLFHCHKGDEQVRTSKIAEIVNALSREDGESLKVSSETVGHVLKNLGLYSSRLGSAGRGLRLEKSIQSRAHELSLAYRVLPTVPDCGYCQRIQALESEEVM
jgi:hypothetical protein